ncbi:hypothetical protein ABTX77_35570 [Streptomyces sp. NPDC097704]|uniref:hypothetical protein n=1 Tax=Streptomyces sp. NPDC097704 TaxID=3157101 RepID=UPI00332169E8
MRAHLSADFLKRHAPLESRTLMIEQTLDNTLPVHPRTGDCALGLCRDGRPIWPIKGGSGGGGDPTPRPRRRAIPTPRLARRRPPIRPPKQQLAEATTRAEQAAAARDERRAALDAVTRPSTRRTARASRTPPPWPPPSPSPSVSGCSPSTPPSRVLPGVVEARFQSVLVAVNITGNGE